jgi:hypothetical protein
MTVVQQEEESIEDIADQQLVDDPEAIEEPEEATSPTSPPAKKRKTAATANTDAQQVRNRSTFRCTDSLSSHRITGITK